MERGGRGDAGKTMCAWARSAMLFVELACRTGKVQACVCARRDLSGVAWPGLAGSATVLDGA